MKYKLIIVFLFLGSFAYSYELHLADYSFNSIANMQYTDVKDNNLVVFGIRDYNGFVYLYNGNQWQEIETLIKTDTGDSKLIVDFYSKIVFGKNNDLWINGKNSLYHYENNEWREFKIDDSLASIRQYMQMTVDNNNKVFLATYIHVNTPRFMRAEILKFEDGKFEEIYSNDYSFSFLNLTSAIFSSKMECMSNNNIFLVRNVRAVDSAAGEKDLYIIKPDLTIERKWLMAPDSIIDNKAVTQIYKESDNKIWFCYDEKTYYPNGTENPPVYYSAGLSLYENDSWYMMNEKNGFFKSHRGTYPSIYGIVKTDYGKYWAFGEKKMFSFDSDYIVDTTNWQTIIENSEYIRTNVNVWTQEEAYSYLEKTINETTAGTPAYRRMVKTSDGTIWIMFNKGLLKVNPTFLSVQEFQETNESLIVYPNPASSELNISAENYQRVEIYDIMGKLVFSQNAAISQIDVSSLSQGTYYLKIYFQNNSIKNLMFIKK